MRLLTDLLLHSGQTLSVPAEASSIKISSITCDSRQVVAGSLFVALKGEKMDGADFIAQAKRDGAAAVLCAQNSKVGVPIPIVRAAEPRLALAQIAAAFYQQQPAHMVAVTGTDGKTSTADFFRQFWHGMRQESASIGTLGVLSGSGKTLFPGSHTTPDSVELHKLLAHLHNQEVPYVAMEASSHGLHQYRLDGVRLDAAAFTNLTRDHMDYHKTEEAYFLAKARLFSELLPPGKTAVLNKDDRTFPELERICKERGHVIMSYGRNDADLKIAKIEPHGGGQHVLLELMGEEFDVNIPLVGAFQVMNILAALGLCVATGAKVEKALKAVANFKGVPGRLEQVASLGNGATVFIDYAHTPMALSNILKTLRPHTKGRLHVVFGCGGDRDKGKRPQMGQIAGLLADNVIVTDDNPRSEDAASIRAAILAETQNAKEVADRRRAIYAAMKELGKGDVLVIAGKGHEKTQIIGNHSMPFDDAEVAKDAVRELKLG